MADEEAPQSQNLGEAVTKQLTDSIKNMDVMNVLKKLVSTSTEDEESEEIRQKLQGVIDQFNSMGEEEKAVFTAKVKEGLAKKLSAKLLDPSSGMNLDKLEQAIGDAIIGQLYWYGAAFLVFILILVFFGYKLYKSIKDKEKKKEDKKKAKQMKKKK